MSVVVSEFSSPAIAPREAAAVRPLKVCFPFVGDDVGGSHVSAVKLLKALDRTQVSPVVTLQETRGPLADFLRGEGVPWLELPLNDTLKPRGGSLAGAAGYMLRTLPLVARFLRQGRFDVVHTNDARIHVNWGLGAALAGASLVWHHRGDPGARAANRLAPLVARQMITVSSFSRPSRPILPMRRRLSVIHSPFDHPTDAPDRDASKAALLAELGLAPATRVLGYFGQLIERKRPLLFVDIVARLRRAHPEIPVVGCFFGTLAPGGPDLVTAVRERAAALGISENIRLMGYRQPVEPAMAATDVLLVPAVGEPFGRTLIEAMFLGTPVVATNHGGNPEAIRDGETGFLVAPENADAFAGPIARLLTDPVLFADIAARARAEAYCSYSVERHVAEVMAIYARLAPRGRRGQAEDRAS